MKFERGIQLHLKGSKRLLLLLLSLRTLRSDIGIDVVVTLGIISDFQLTLTSRSEATAVFVALPTHHSRV